MALDNLKSLREGSASNGTLLERLVAAIHQSTAADVDINWNDNIGGRQFDVTIRFKKSGYDYVTAIECKDYAGKVPVEKVEAFITKTLDAHIDKAVMVSTQGFQPAAIAVAKRHGIRLLTIADMISEAYASPSAERVEGVSILGLNIRRKDGGPDISPKDSTAKFAYLWKNITVNVAGKDRPLVEIADRLRPAVEETMPLDKEQIIFDCKPGALVRVPYEEAFEAIEISYWRKRTRFVVRNSPDSGLDPFLQIRSNLEFEIRDEDGSVVHFAKIAEIPFGFDSKANEGSFYEAPSSGFVYYLERVEDTKLLWILLESYQHGTLLQAEILEDRGPSLKGRVEISEKVELTRLRRMLADFKAYRTPRPPL